MTRHCRGDCVTPGTCLEAARSSGPKPIPHAAFVCVLASQGDPMSDASRPPRAPSVDGDASQVRTIDDLFTAGLLARVGTSPMSDDTSAEFWEGVKRGRLSYTLPLRAALRAWEPADSSSRERRDALME